MDVLRQGCIALIGHTISWLTLEKSKTSLDVNIGGVQLRSPRVGIERVIGLIVTRLVKGTQIVPDLGYVGVQTNGARVCVECVPVLVDLIVENTN